LTTRWRRNAQRTTVQADVARAEALYLSSRAFFYDVVPQSWEAAQAGRELSVREVAVLRLARTPCRRRCKRSI
jgi:hypothetical protein